jgi:S1-C subfamily serine protease
MEPAEIDRIYGIWAEPVPGEINWATDDAERAQRARELTPDQEDAMRARMGDAGYDAMLYATGKNNRLLVTDVPEGTPGWDAGLQPGDQILYLDDERIFDRSALNWKEAGLPRSGSVPLVVLREGEWVELTVEGGRVRAKLIGGLFPPYRP